MPVPQQMNDYAMAAAEDHFELVKIVEEQIQAGWQPFNAVFTYQYGEQHLICQPLVKYGIIKKKRVIKKRIKK